MLVLVRLGDTVVDGLVEGVQVRRDELKVLLELPDPVRNGPAGLTLRTCLGPVVLEGSLLRWRGSTSELGVKVIETPEVPDWSPVPGVPALVAGAGAVRSSTVVRVSGRKVWLDGISGVWRGDSLTIEVRGHRGGGGSLRVPVEVEETRGAQARLKVLNHSSVVALELSELGGWVEEVQRAVLWMGSVQRSSQSRPVLESAATELNARNARNQGSQERQGSAQQGQYCYDS